MKEKEEKCLKTTRGKEERMLWLTREIAEKIKKAKGGKIKLSLDLGRSYKEWDVEKLKNLPLDEVKKDFIYAYDGKNLIRLALFTDHYYRLRLFNGIPILEVDGVRMHVVKGFKNPLEYAKRIVKKLKVSKEDIILDCCTGLGYLAIELAKKGKKVITVEKSDAVLWLAKANPWSRELFTMENVTIVNEDILSFVKKTKEKFTIITHDPPRLSHAPLLYSRPFYKALHRISEKGARLFHYVGRVGHKKGRKLSAEVKKRLEESGWKVIEEDPLLQGIFAVRKLQ